MRDIRELYEALLDGKTLVNKKNTQLTLENSSALCIGTPKQWSIYEDTWKIEPAEWFISNWGDVMRSDEEGITITQEFGMVYHTEELAERARDEMKESNLLRYWVSVIDPEWAPDWKDRQQKKWYISLSISGKEYYKMHNLRPKAIGTVYMSEETATKICEALNSGELVIGDEL